MHFHLGTLDFLFVYLPQFILAGLLIRLVTIRFPNSGVAKALAFIH